MMARMITDEAMGLLLSGLRKDADLSQRKLASLFTEHIRSHSNSKKKIPQNWVFICEKGKRRISVPEFLLWCEFTDTTPTKALKRLKKTTSSIPTP